MINSDWSVQWSSHIDQLRLLILPVSVKITLLQRGRPLGRRACKTPNQGVESSFCHWSARQRLAWNELFFHGHRYHMRRRATESRGNSQVVWLSQTVTTWVTDILVRELLLWSYNCFDILSVDIVAIDVAIYQTHSWKLHWHPEHIHWTFEYTVKQTDSMLFLQCVR